MRSGRPRHRWVARLSLILACFAWWSPASAQLAPEPIPNVESLPADYPESWVFLLDANFFGIEAGKLVIADIGHDVDHHKGALSLAQFGNFAEATTRPELYTIETFYSRGSRGERTDTLTIYDKSTLLPAAEIILPDGKRAQMLTEKGAFQLSHDERFAYVFNFTPAASIYVVDLVERRIASEIEIPGCAHAFPLGAGGFASLCGNGAMVSMRLDETGALASQSMGEPFHDLDNDPMFSRPAIVGDMYYFPSYDGHVQPVDLSGEAAQIGAAWTIPGLSESGAAWRPSGWQLSTSDSAGRIYFIMRKGAGEGDHDTGGGEVWVFDPATQSRVQRIALRRDAMSIEVTRGDDPYLVVVGPDMSLDVYSANTGEWVRNIGGQIALTPFAVYAAQ